MQNFHFSLPVEVRFADLDALGHLNNAKYLTYAEQARILYIQQICGWDGDWKTLGMILARTEIDYKLPIAFGDAVVVYLRTSRIGGKSFDLDDVLSRQRGNNPPEIAATVKTIMVSYDYEQDISIPVPQNWREAMLAYESSLSSSD